MDYLTTSDRARINNYDLYGKIFDGDHFDAFNVMSRDFKKDYSHLRYLAINFGGLLSKVSADMLFEEPPKMTTSGDKDFLHGMIDANQLQIQFYESGLEQSYNGDVVFRLRGEDGRLIIEDINPSIWFPEIDAGNVRAEPKAHVLKWKVMIDRGNQKTEQAVFIEKHLKGKIEYELYILEANGNLGAKLTVGEYFKRADGKPLADSIETGVDDFLIIHIPNFRTNRSYYGISDYKDLMTLMFALNNRFTAIDNILDKHGEPILALPKGILDETGKVNRKKFGVIEFDATEANGSLPTYIVWDAKLESAFMQIDKMMDSMFLFSDMSKSLFGLDTGGQQESGRALKYKLLRTIAKKHRKELYYDWGMKKLFMVAQKFAKANSLKVNGKVLQGNPVEPTITWQDGIINDALEQLEIEERKLDKGLTTKADSIAVIDGIEEDEALKKLRKIEKEKASEGPKFSADPFFQKKDQNPLKNSA